MNDPLDISYGQAAQILENVFQKPLLMSGGRGNGKTLMIAQANVALQMAIDVLKELDRRDDDGK